MIWPFRKKPSLDPKIEQIFKKVQQLLQDEELQNEQLPEPLRKMILLNAACDRVPGATGEFGRSLSNPIPVNGPLGSLIYLSSLETLSGKAVAFHRIGSRENIDIYHLIDEDGNTDKLLLSMYFPRRSRQLPTGYRARPGVPTIRGTNGVVASFPSGIFAAAMDAASRLVGVPCADTSLKRWG
jgi:hypothetical protein